MVICLLYMIVWLFCIDHYFDSFTPGWKAFAMVVFFVIFTLACRIESKLTERINDLEKTVLKLKRDGGTDDV